MNRCDIVREARSIYADYYGDVPECQGCVYLAEAFNQAAARRGLDVILQAGTAMFQFRADDGSSDTHFSYVFDKASAMARLTKGLWPEMHAWSYVRTTGEIVDLSLKHQSEQAKRLCGFEWQPEFVLPEYIWTMPETLSVRTVYHADLVACMLALKFLRQEKKELAQVSISANMSCGRKNE